jgi:hypothetical protein
VEIPQGKGKMNSDVIVYISCLAIAFISYAFGWSVGYKTGKSLGYRRGKNVGREIGRYEVINNASI